MRFITIRKKVKEKRETKPLTSRLWDSIQEYHSISTVHGLRYITDPKQHALGRAFWLLVGLIFLSLTAYQIYCLRTQWKTEDPTITTLATMNLPIDQIEFPSVTICPQGSVLSILKGITFREFVHWVRTKSPLAELRTKRSSFDSLAEPWNRTYIEIMDDLKNFTRDFYGIEEGNPIQLATMLNAEDPEETLFNEALLFPNGEKYCDEFTEEELEDEMNLALNQHYCPSGFTFIKGMGCVMPTNFQMTYREAVGYCNGLEGDASLLHIDPSNMDDKIKNLKAKGIIGKSLISLSIVKIGIFCSSNNQKWSD